MRRFALTFAPCLALLAACAGARPAPTGADPGLALLRPAELARVRCLLLAPVERILARLDAGVAITSGYLTTDHPRVPGWKVVDRLELDGWAADRFERTR